MIADALRHDFLAHHVMPLSHYKGSAVLMGKRHPWSLNQGTVAPEILGWLRGDPALQLLDFWMPGRDRKGSFDSGKWAVGGSTLRVPVPGRMCTLDVSRPLPMPRAVAWLTAFKSVSAPAFARMESKALRDVAAASRNTKAGLSLEHPNVSQFRTTPLAEWAGSAAEICTVPLSARDRLHFEDRHLDGGASILHFGLTIYGRRSLWIEQPDCEDHALQQIPGSFYVGTLTGPVHQVEHLPADPCDVLKLPASRVALTILCRSQLFAAYRSRTKSTTPAPTPFFATLAASLSESLRQDAFILPSLSDVKAAETLAVPA